MMSVLTMPSFFSDDLPTPKVYDSNADYDFGIDISALMAGYGSLAKGSWAKVEAAKRRIRITLNQ